MNQAGLLLVFLPFDTSLDSCLWLFLTLGLYPLMGSVFRRKYKDKRGRVRQALTYEIQYYIGGRKFRESSGSTKHSDAVKLLRQREGEIANGRNPRPRMDRVALWELAEDVINDYEMKRRKTLKDVKRRLNQHILPFFGPKRQAISIGSAEIREFIVKRQHDGASDAEINRELAALRRAFSLGLQSGRLSHRPYFEKLKESKPRAGFLEREQFERVRDHLPEYLRQVVTFAYITGWRIRSEVLSLEWRQVDFKTRTVRLDPGSTKNEDGRIFPFMNGLQNAFEQRLEARKRLQKDKGVLCPFVFFRANGERIRSFYKAWHTATRKAGYPGLIPHDMRRTAVRNLVWAGVPEKIAMQLTGHRTRCVFDRYTIVSRNDLQVAVERLERVLGGL